MGNAYLQCELAVSRWKTGQRSEAMELMKGVVAQGGEAATAYLMELLVGIADPQLEPVLAEVRKSHEGQPLDEEAKRILKGFRDPRALRELTEQAAAEKQMGNQFAWVEQAVRRERSGDREGALLALRMAAARGGEAAGQYLVTKLTELADAGFVPLLEELAANRGRAWLGDKTREAIEEIGG